MRRLPPWKIIPFSGVTRYPYLGMTSYSWGWHVRLFGGWVTIVWQEPYFEKEAGKRCIWWSRNGGLPCKYSFFILKPKPGSFIDRQFWAQPPDRGHFATRLGEVRRGRQGVENDTTQDRSDRQAEQQSR